MNEPRHANLRRLPRLAEFAALYFGLPLLLRAAAPARAAIPALWLAACAAAIFLCRDASFDRRTLFSWSCPAKLPRRLLMRFALCAAALALLLLAVRPELLFSLPRKSPRLWLLVIVLYPLLSVYPQGIVFRALYAHRYAPAFGGRFPRLLAGAAAFAFAHILFRNWWAILFTFCGGLMFLPTCEKTRSLPISCLEHALYGDLLFTLGWGAYLFSGGTVAMIGG